MADDTPDDDYTTDSTVRWTAIGSLLAGISVASLPALVLGAAAEMLKLGPIPQSWFILYFTVVLMAATWTWGEETLKAVQRARSKK